MGHFTISNRVEAHGITGHWNNVHRMINELEWSERYLKAGGSN